MRSVIRNGSCTSSAMISAGSRGQQDVTRQGEGPSGKQQETRLCVAPSLARPEAGLRLASQVRGARPC